MLNSIITGATGMVGSGVLIEALESPLVGKVLVVGRRSCGVKHPKLTEIIHDNFLDYSQIEAAFNGYNACFWCLGASSFAMKEADYRRITVDYGDKAAAAIARHCPEMNFCYLSGEGADSTEASKAMWVRLKGMGENCLKKFGFNRLFFFRPAYIHPLKGVKPSFFMYRFSWASYPILKRFMPKYVSTTAEVGQAMINAALHGYEKQIITSQDIVKLAKGN